MEEMATKGKEAFDKGHDVGTWVDSKLGLSDRLGGVTPDQLERDTFYKTGAVRQHARGVDGIQAAKRRKEMMCNHERADAVRGRDFERQALLDHWCR